MDILEGLLFINDQDVYKTCGAFLTEDKWKNQFILLP